MRVLWVSHSGHIGGSELSLLEGAAALRERGVHVTVAVPEGGGGLADRLAKVRVPTVEAAIWWWTQLPAMSARERTNVARSRFGMVRGLQTLIRRVKPDVVVTNTITMPTAAIAARLSGVPHVWFLHEYGVPEHGIVLAYGQRVSTLAIRVLSRRVIVNSPALARHFGPMLGNTPIDLAHYAVETPKISTLLPKRCASLELVLVGGRQAGKRQEDAIRALANLYDRGVDARLTLVGPSHSDYESYLKMLTYKYEVSDRVEFVDHVDKPGSYIAAADVALMCSENEAFGRVTIEAMKLGRPVIGAASGGYRRPD